MTYRTVTAITLTSLSMNAHAAVFNVNSTLDIPDSTLGDCLCAAGPLAVCTLRAAVMEANNCATTPHQINVPANTYNLTIGGAGLAAVGDLDVLQDMTITGAGQTTTIVDGFAMGDRIFDVNSAASLTLEDITLRKGATATPGGGIRNAGTLSLDAVTVKQCSSSAAAGGGISNTGTATLAGSTLSNNTASLEGGGLFNTGTATLAYSTVKINTSGQEGGGIFNTGSLALSDSYVNGNTASGTYDGGGLYTDSASTTTLTDSSVLDNVAGGDGGGVYGATAVTVSGSDISGNAAAGDGGGFYAGADLDVTTTWVQNNDADNGGGVYAAADLTISHATLSSNSASPGNGGGVYVVGADAIVSQSDIWENDALSGDGGGFYLDDATLDIEDSTVDANTARYDGGGLIVTNGATVTAHQVTLYNNNTIAGDGGGFYGDDYTFSDSIIESNTAPSAYDECYGAPTSAGYNNINNASGGCTWTAAGTDITGSSSFAGPWTSGANPGQSYRNLNAAGDANGTGGDCTGNDQVGTARSSPCDRGPVEM